MTPASAPMLLGQLLSDSWSFCRTYWKPVLIAAVVLGTIAGFVGGSVSHRAGRQVGGVMQQMGVDMQKMEELTQRMQAGDESAGREIEQMINDRFDGMSDEQSAAMMAGFGAGMFSAVLPLVGVSVLVMIILGVFAGAYFLILSLSPMQDAVAVARKTPMLFFPLLGVWLWSFLRSFAWIPVIGIIPAVILGPRFVLAPVLLVQEKMGVMQSVRESYARTGGYWGKIVGNLIVAGLCTVLASIVASIAIGILSMLLPLLAYWVSSIVNYLLTAFLMVFMVKLSITILANPRMQTVQPLTPAKASKKK